MIEEKIVEYFDTPKGQGAIVTLGDPNRFLVRFSTIGAGILSILTPDYRGNMVDVVLGYQNPVDYLYDGPCMGKTPGRYANRIAGGRFSLRGKEYQLPVNNGPNHLHGGPEGFQNQLWNLANVFSDRVEFSLLSPDGHMGYPGNVIATVSYHVNVEKRNIHIKYAALSDRDTPINLTNHTYFNLNGHDSGSVLGHVLVLACDRYYPTDPTLIPQEEYAFVQGTPMDFRLPHSLGQNLEADYPALRYGKGYDSYWTWDPDKKPKPVARIVGEKTGIVLEVDTDQEGVQLYTGNYLSGCPLGKGGVVYEDYSGVALECCDIPDGPNRSDWDTFLYVDEPYQRYIHFRFGMNGEC